jgi:uncharacterized protein YbcI
VDERRPTERGGARLDEQSVTGPLTNAVIHVTKEYLGRGPTKGRAYIQEDIVVVLLGETLTKAERSLVNDGKTERVLSLRQEFKRTMKDELVAEVEHLTGRRVIAFMSDTHIDPDLACDVFVLEPVQAEAPAWPAIPEAE